MTMIAVQSEFPIRVEDADGRWWTVCTSPGVYDTIPASCYRRNAWMGLFRRRLRRVRGYGREFWIDEFWRRRQAHDAIERAVAAARPAWVPVDPPAARRSGCGCQGKAG